MDPLFAVFGVGMLALIALWLLKRYFRVRYGTYDVTKKRSQ